MNEKEKLNANAGDSQAAYAVAALSNMDKDFDTAFEYAMLSVSLSGAKKRGYTIGSLLKFRT